jgi:glyoxylase-like metal-dependent hydrolase (beta-lactamase superfamily II)
MTRGSFFKRNMRMKRALKWTGGIVAIILISLAIVLFWLFYSNQATPDSRFPLDLGELRRVSGTVPGAGPALIEIERLSHTMVPRIAIVSGTGWGKIDMVRASYRLVFPDRTILIDTANSADLAKRFKAASYDSAAWKRLVPAMESASAIVVTHEHADHIGGLLESPHRDALFGRAVLTSEQAADMAGSLPLHWPDLAALNFHPLSYDRLHALAPGVVLIKAPGHTSGSQMVYVRRADGREYLFTGDTTSLLDNVTLKRIRSRYVTDWYGDQTHDDRPAVMAQTIAIHDLAQKYPDLIIVPGHDGRQMLRLIHEGLLTPRFTP